MKIAVIGTGYVGLVTGTCLAESGNDVACIDKDDKKIAKLNVGGMPIYEPGLLELVQRNRRDGRLTFTTDLAAGVREAKLVFIAVGTPQGPDGSTDLTAIQAVGTALATAVEPDAVVILKSTVPVGTNRLLSELMAAKAGRAIEVANNPEFLKEGAAVDDFMKPDRVVVGARKPEVVRLLHELYAPFLRNEQPFLDMTPESAELTKYVANAMLATKISFINEMANLCEKLGADINDVRRGIGSDRRIGFQFLHPGPGYGGSCFPKDLESLIHQARAVGARIEIVEAVDRVNDLQKKVLADKVRRHFGVGLPGKCLAIWGLAFKPRTDDIREAPALEIINALLDEGVKLQVHDPEALANVKAVYGDRLRYFDRPYGALEGADGLILVTEWQEFRHADFDMMRRLMAGHVIFDGRNLYDPKIARGHGFIYHGIGRAAS